MTTTTSATADRAQEIRRVEEALATLIPRWSAWTLLTLHATGPVRPVDLKKSLPMPSTSALSNRLAALTDAGLLERRAKHAHNVTYGLSERGRRLIPALDTLAAWATRHPFPGEDAPVAYAERIEETLLHLGGRHTAAVLWTLRERGEVRVAALHKAVAPHLSLPTLSLKLTQLARDGLIERERDDQRAPYRLTAESRDLARPLAALSTWVAGGTPGPDDTHPVWNPAPAKTKAAGVTPAPAARQHPNQQAAVRAIAAVATPAARVSTRIEQTRRSDSPAWGAQLFSHAGPARSMPAQAGGRAR
ncbi:winged helix-turn-helix transcriptional regulator [Streptomyces nigrescens]